MTTKTVNLRSTARITEYVKTCDRIARLASELKELERNERLLRPAVLDEIGERRSVAVSGVVRTLTRTTTVSVSRIVDDATAAAACQAAGLDIDERSAVFVSPAKLRKYALAGQIPDGIVDVSETPGIAII